MSYKGLLKNPNTRKLYLLPAEKLQSIFYYFAHDPD